MRLFHFACLFIVLLLISGCQATAEQSAAPLTGPAIEIASETDLEAAGYIARDFLNAWALGDFETMYRLLTFRNRELTPFDAFRAQYQRAHDKLSLERLDFTLQNVTADGRVVTAQYAVIFYSRALGDARAGRHQRRQTTAASGY